MGVFAAVSIITSAVLSILALKRGPLFEFKKLCLAGFSSIGGFLLGTPNALFEYQTFLRTDSPVGALWQFTRVGNSGDLSLVVKLLQRKNLLFQAMGVLPAVASGFGFVLLVTRRSWEYVLLGVFPLLYFLYVGNFYYFQPHFFLPLYPYLSLLSGLVLVDLTGQLRDLSNLSILSHIGDIRRVKILGALGFLMIFLAQPVYNTWQNRTTILRPDTRTVALEWIKSDIPDGVGIATGKDYEPIIPAREGPRGIDNRADRYYLSSFSDLERDHRLGNELFRFLHETQVEYLVFGTFGLGEVYDQAEWREEKTTREGWLKKYAELVQRFEPKGRPGPTVLIFKLKSQDAKD